MDISLNHALSGLVVALSVARFGEQGLVIHRSRSSVRQSKSINHVSVLAPLAGVAALLYGYSIGSDPTMLGVAWINASNALICWVHALSSRRPSPSLIAIDAKQVGENE